MPLPIGWNAFDDRIGGLLAPPGKTPQRHTSGARLPAPAPPPPPRPAAPQQAAHAPAQPRIAPRKAPLPRGADEASAKEQRPPPAGQPEQAVAAIGERDGRGSGGDDEQGQEQGQDSAVGERAGAALDDGLTAAEIAALLPGADVSGVFEVVLPGGEALGVAVDTEGSTVCYLLTPQSDTLAARLRGQRMELAGQVERRIGRSVRLTVL